MNTLQELVATASPIKTTGLIDRKTCQTHQNIFLPIMQDKYSTECAGASKDSTGFEIA